jgi:hypothetical protein
MWGRKPPSLLTKAKEELAASQRLKAIIESVFIPYTCHGKAKSRSF